MKDRLTSALIELKKECMKYEKGECCKCPLNEICGLEPFMWEIFDAKSQ